MSYERGYLSSVRLSKRAQLGRERIEVEEANDGTTIRYESGRVEFIASAERRRAAELERAP